MVAGLKSIIVAISQAILPIVGRTYASGNRQNLNKIFGIYEMIILFLSFLLFTIGGLTITPFVKLYTSCVYDANYNQPVFGWLIIVSELVYCIREPYVSLAFSANRFKDFKSISYIEAILNIVISIIFVKKFGIVGVAIGTLISMLTRTIYQINYLKNNILKRSYIKLYKIIIIYIFGSVISSVLSQKFISDGGNTILGWIGYAAKNGIVVILVLVLLTLFFYHKQISSWIIEFSKTKEN